jgi:hypothetical protein
LGAEKTNNVSGSFNKAAVCVSEEVVDTPSSSLNKSHLGLQQQPLPHNPTPAAPHSSQDMAVFEVDLLSWLPRGHQIIDGGPTRLPRTYYYASQDPPAMHQDHCIALLEPPPPQAADHWRDQVHNFLIGPLRCNVHESRPSLFYMGLYQLSGQNSVNALVQHGQLQNRLLRFVHVGEAPQNHHAAMGFRCGWLMFLGTEFSFMHHFLHYSLCLEMYYLVNLLLLVE